MALGPDNFATFARCVGDPSGARKATITPVKLEVVHSERNLANLLSFEFEDREFINCCNISISLVDPQKGEQTAQACAMAIC